MNNIKFLSLCKRKATKIALLLLAWMMLLPAMPAWADDIGKYEIKVVAKPTKAGSFNTNKDSVSAGQMVQLMAYANSNFSFKEWVDEQGNVVSDQQNFQYNMPAHNVTLTAIYTFDPTNPSNPNKNFWDKATGNVIVDDFKAGSLQSAISQAIGSNNSSKVLAITVAGRVNNNDFGIANNYTNYTTLDLSRTTGVNEVPSYAFDYTKLQTVILPATIEKIGYRAFYQCNQLSAITCYAMTPPSVGSYAFYGVQDGMVVFVPAVAVTQYQEADGWKNFTILPIQNDIRIIKVSLPQDANIADYANMYLELTNTKSGQRMHYVMTDKHEYAFANIIKNTAWNVTIRNERGDVFGEIKNVELKDEDAIVSFDKLKKPQHINLKVLAPNGNDVTAQTSITWTTEQGDYISQGNEMNGILEGSKLVYNIALSQSLTMIYDSPSQGIHVTKRDSNNIVCQLSALPQILIKGNVKDANTGMAISNATISASQTFGGKYGKTIGTQTDDNGNYTIVALKVPTTLTIASTDYISKVLSCDSLIALNADTITAQQALLRPIEGATIALDFSYRTCADSANEETSNWYSDYNNIAYTIYNNTKQCAINNFSVQYPRIVLLDEASVGDKLTITATSRTNDFMPVSLTTVIDSTMLATASFEIVEKGQIQASFAKNNNEQVVGSLYDADGKLLTSANYSNTSLTFTSLSDGAYTLVTMGKSTLFNTIYDLSKLTETGLIEGTDYVVNNLTVKSGEITTLSIENVPTLDESKLYYTGDNTLFAVNKSSIVVGNYLTLSAQLDFKQAYAKDISNVNVVVDLPTSCQFVENSVMVGNAVNTYTCNGSRITIPVANYTDRVRFCIIPTQGGDYAPSAFVQFEIKGKSIVQPIGAANYTAKNLSISVPVVAVQKEIPINGTAVGQSYIDIYDNDVIIGQTRAMANGCWSATCLLNKPYNLSVHNIYAIATTTTGIKLSSEVVDCTYDMNAVQVNKVTMYHWNPEQHTTYTSIFDFCNPATSSNKWIVYYPKKVFTYTIDFTNNSPNVVSNVVLYVHTADKNKIPLKASYNKEKNIWIAHCNLGGSCDLRYPVNVSVGYNVETQLDTIAIMSMLDYAINDNASNDIKMIDNIQENNHYLSTIKFFDETMLLDVTCETLDKLPNNQTFQTDTLCGNYVLYINSDYTNGNSTVCIPKATLYCFKNAQNEKSKDFYRWATTMCTSNYLALKVNIRYNQTTKSITQHSSIRKSPITPLYTLKTIKNFKEMNKKTRERYMQLKRLMDRMDKLDCIDEDVKQDLTDGINKLFQQYFNIKLASTAMSSSPAKITSPLYAINYSAGWLNFAGEIGFEMQRKSISNSIKAYENFCPPSDNSSDNEDYSNTPDDNVQIDPSGYVYESVLSNRLEGVKATVYYKEMVEDMYGDLHENIVKWNAEEYAQKNPLFTDENGFYRWDVPQGLWQVKFEKEGYETTYSDWLPVPPPQLDVNIGMKQNIQPTVKDAKAYEDAVELTFDKYMMTETLNTDNIFMMVNNKSIKGQIELLNEEADYNDNSKHYASKLRFNANEPFGAPIVNIIVKNQVKSYAGIRMESDYMQSFAVSKEIKRIECDSAMSIEYGKSSTIDIAVLPAAAAAGKEVEVKLSSDLIISTTTTKCTLDEEGRAQIVVNGELPGMAAITFKLSDEDLSATTIISVREIQIQPVAAPTANIATGSMVAKGTAITLQCNTEGAQIYYTLDGSCPCDNTEARKLYDGTPILINADTEIKAMAYMDGEESEVVTLFYKVLVADNVGEANAKSIKIYPTLVKDMLHVDINEGAKGSLFITDANGRQILNIDNAQTHNTINMTGLTSGMYIVVVRTEDGKCTTKIIKL